VNKKEKIAVAFMTFTALTGGIVIGINIDAASVNESPTISKSGGATNARVEICRNLESLPYIYKDARFALSDREAFDFYRGSEGVTDPAIIWNSKLEVDGKEAFQKLHESAQSVASDVFNAGVVTDVSWNSLKSSFRQTFEYCNLQTAVIDEYLGD
jgi:hypothetical protein